jgi:hypothetical protein
MKYNLYRVVISNEMVKLRFERLVNNLNKNPTIQGLA